MAAAAENKQLLPKTNREVEKLKQEWKHDVFLAWEQFNVVAHVA